VAPTVDSTGVRPFTCLFEDLVERVPDAVVGRE
jgi:hypothetical protein